MTHRKTCIIVFACCLVLNGCAYFQDYNRMTRQARVSMSQGSYPDALATFPSSAARGGNEILIRMERGTLLQAMGQYKESAAEFEVAAKKIAYYENRAVISASKGASEAASLVINEKAIPYEGEDFEKVLIHAFDALNYLMLGDLEDARVEIRNAYRRQQELYDKHYKDLEKAQKNVKGMRWEDPLRRADPQGYHQLMQTAESVASIYQNAFAYYISSLVYELNLEVDEAYIDLKKAIDAAPNCRAIQRDLIRLSKDLHYNDDLERWENSFGKMDPVLRDGIDIFVVFEFGLAPHKEQVKFPILTGSGIVSAAFPVYRFTPSATVAGMVSCNERGEKTSIVSDMDAIAARNLLDEFPILLAKQIARSVLKGYATRQLRNEYGAGGVIAGSIVSIITEQADLRTWSTLPKQVHVARLFVPKLTREITISALPIGGTGTMSIPERAKHVVILARASDGVLSIHSQVY